MVKKSDGKKLSRSQKESINEIANMTPKMEKLADTLSIGWASIITSAIDPGITYAIPCNPIYSPRTIVAGLGNKRKLYVSYVCGCTNEMDTVFDGERFVGSAKNNAQQMKELGLLLKDVALLCVKNNLFFDDYVDRELKLQHNTAKTIMRISELDLPAEVGFENMKMISSIKGSSAREEAVQALMEEESSPDSVRVQMKDSAMKEEERETLQDPKKKLQKEKEKIEKTIKTLNEKLEKVEKMIEDLE
jgi:hypothetical protein